MTLSNGKHYTRYALIQGIVVGESDLILSHYGVVQALVERHGVRAVYAYDIGLGCEICEQQVQ